MIPCPFLPGKALRKLRFNASNLFESSNWFGETKQPEINLMVFAVVEASALNTLLQRSDEDHLVYFSSSDQ